MNYKVLVEVFVPSIEQSYEMYIPVNRTLKYVAKILIKVVNDSTSNAFSINDNIQLCNRRNGNTYNLNDYIRNTDIRNGSQIVIF